MFEKEKTNQQNMPEACDTCALNTQSRLKKLGVNIEDTDFVVALAGNPNTGKSTVFNALTGLRQHTGNWAGKTVARAEGAFQYNESRFKLIDLPGTYSLLSTSEDEEVARNFILFGKPDVTVIVADASRLERNLNLVLQVLEITDKAVLCINLMDEATRHGIEIDDRTLARDLGIPVVKATARSQKGIPELIKVIAQVANNEIACQPHRIKNLSPKVKKAIDDLSEKIQNTYPGLPNSRWVAMRLLDGDQQVLDGLKDGSLLD